MSSAQVPQPPGNRRSQSGCPLRRWIPLLLVLAVLAGWTAFVVRPDSAERAERAGWLLLERGRPERAAERFEGALRADPSRAGAWRGLLEARPTSATCRRLAQNMPQLFDTMQPVQDERLLVRDGTRGAAEWKKSLAVYEKAVLAGAHDGLLALDFLGRKDLNRAWQGARAVEAELRSALDASSRPGALKPFAAHDLAAARKLLVRSVGRFDDSERWLALLVQMNAARAAEETGLRRLAEAAEKEPAFVPTQLTLAYVELARGGPAAAEERCRGLLAAGAAPLSFDAEARVRYCLARALEATGRGEDAAAEVRAILARRPDDAAARLRLAELYLERRQIDEAEEVIRGLARGPAAGARQSYLEGVICLARNDPKAAIVHLNNAFEHTSHDLRVRYCLGRAWQGAGQYASAYHAFSQVAAEVSEPAWSLAAASACALAGGRVKEAAQAARAALREAPADPQHAALRDHAKRFRAAVLGWEGRAPSDLAAADLVRTERNRELAYFLIAGLWAAEGYVSEDADIAVDDARLEFFRERAPKEPAARYGLAFLLLGAGRIAEGRTQLETLLREQPGHPLAALHLARLHLLDGKTEEAARLLEETGLAHTPGPVARQLELIASLQGVPVGGGPSTSEAQEPGDEVVGPHLALFATAAHADPLAYARQVLLLDPVDDFGARVLRLTYADVREGGLESMVTAAKRDEATGAAIRRGVALYHAPSDRIYRLVVGSFWKDMPLGL